MNSPRVKTRFCPSPTGLLHLGSARTVLFNWLYAKNQDGSLLLRIEDTDRERSEEQYNHAIFEDLRWLGLEWDEGPEVGGKAGPYYQSERQAIYDQEYQKLESTHVAYPCFCTEEDLALARKIQRSQGKPPRYPGTCLKLSEAEREAKLKAGESFTLRFHVPDEAVIEFHDLVKGVQRFLGKDLGDFIIRRADGTPPFMYCNAIDDALMSVTHALRGDDHVTNTPRQLLIYKALGLKAPQYGHMGLIVGADHTQLSKRNGSRSIQVLREEGFLPIAIVNYLARLGHSYDNNHLMTLNELVSEFRLDHLSSSPSTFDHQQLLHWQKEAVMRLEEKAFWVWAGSIDEIPVEKRSAFFKAIQPNVVFPDEVKHWADILFKENWTFSDTSRTILHETHQAYFEEALSLLSGESIAYPAILDHLKNKLGLKGKALFQPLRVALTNELHGPELAPLVELLGNDVVKERLEKARTC